MGIVSRGLFDLGQTLYAVEDSLLKPETGAEQDIVAGVFRFKKSCRGQNKIRVAGVEITVTYCQCGFGADVITQAHHQLGCAHQI